MIVDDEPLAREVLSRFVARVPFLKLIGECENAVQAISAIQRLRPNLAFVDIQMPEVLGTDLIRILNQPPKIIITTAFAKYALEGYELEVLDYLLKPISFERFLKAINKATMLTSADQSTSDEPSIPASEKTSYLYFRTDRKMMKVMLDDILYVEGMKNYIKIITVSGMIITKHSIAAAEAMLPEDAFLRVHRSYIVAESKIRSFTGDTITIGKIELPIGKLFKSQVRRRLG